MLLRPPDAGPSAGERGVLRWMVVLAAAVLVADAMLPRSVAVAGLHILPVLLSLWVGNARLTRWTAVACTVAILLGLLLTAPTAPLWQGLTNRAVALFAVWSTAALGRLRMDVETELRRSRETTATTLASIAEGVVTTDTGGRVAFANAVAERILGWEPGEAAGQPLAELLPGRDPEGDKPSADQLPSAGEATVTTRAGERLVLEASTADIPDPARPGEPGFGRVIVFRDVTARRARQEEVEALAYRDPLTGLANRTSFEDRLELELARARRSERMLALLFLDLDGFKEINDTLGHAAGDELLVAIARRLREILREEDTVARLGGDEFTVLLPGISSPEDAILVAEKVLVALARPHLLDGREVLAPPSVGLALYPEDLGDLDGAGLKRGAEAGHLVQVADQAMYRAKGRGGNRWSRRAEAEQSTG
ncbi:MAG: diguanylate cyclase [Planctomycetota bacterium]